MIQAANSNCILTDFNRDLTRKWISDPNQPKEDATIKIPRRWPVLGHHGAGKCVIILVSLLYNSVVISIVWIVTAHG
jgi:hypothetical protein